MIEPPELFGFILNFVKLSDILHFHFLQDEFLNILLFFRIWDWLMYNKDCTKSSFSNVLLKNEFLFT